MKIIKKVLEKDSNKKIKTYMKEQLGFSTRLTKRTIIDQKVKVNENIIRANYILKTGDHIEIDIEREEEQNIIPEKINLKIEYEDEDIIVINKPPFMVVHPTSGHQSGTLANGILYYFKETNQKSIVRLVNRLDMNTSGLVIVAKNSYTHSMLAKEFQNNNCQKKYYAIIHGKMEAVSGTIDLPIYKESEESIKRSVNIKGQRSITKYKVIETYSESQFLELELLTGRTHQIRVHLSNLKCPIYGDTLYGKEDLEYITRQALQSYSLKFINPRTNKNIFIETDLSKDIVELKEKLKNE